MPLSDLQIYQDQAYTVMTEVLDQEIAKVISASNGTITMRADPITGDHSSEALYKKIPDLVRRRDINGSGNAPVANLEHIERTRVKVAAGTPTVEIDPSQFTWIQKNPEEAGVILGQQLAKDTLADMLNSGLVCAVAAMSGDAEAQSAIIPASGTKASSSDLLSVSRLMGDRYADMRAFVMNAHALHDIYENNMANLERLFVFGTVNIMADAFGRVFVVTDSPALSSDTTLAGATLDVHNILGLTADSLFISTNGDYDSNIEKKNGKENLGRTFQAEWTYNTGVKGYTWNKAIESPTDAQLAASGNWSTYTTSYKDRAGGLLQVSQA